MQTRMPMTNELVTAERLPPLSLHECCSMQRKYTFEKPGYQSRFTSRTTIRLKCFLSSSWASDLWNYSSGIVTWIVLYCRWKFLHKNCKYCIDCSNVKTIQFLYQTNIEISNVHINYLLELILQIKEQVLWKKMLAICSFDCARCMHVSISSLRNETLIQFGCYAGNLNIETSNAGKGQFEN